MASFFQTCVNEAPECDLYICYIGSDYFKETAVIACAYSLAKQQQLTGYIVLTNSAAPMKIYIRSLTKSVIFYLQDVFMENLLMQILILQPARSTTLLQQILCIR